MDPDRWISGLPLVLKTETSSAASAPDCEDSESVIEVPKSKGGQDLRTCRQDSVPCRQGTLSPGTKDPPMSTASRRHMSMQPSRQSALLTQGGEALGTKLVLSAVDTQVPSDMRASWGDVCSEDQAWLMLRRAELGKEWLRWGTLHLRKCVWWRSKTEQLACGKPGQRNASSSQVPWGKRQRAF